MIIKALANGLIINVKVIPNASRNQLLSLDDEFIKIKIAANAEKGKANKELISFLSLLLNWPKTMFSITKGAGARRKTIFISGMTQERFLKHINASSS
jgi:uncharacterized protein